MRSVASIPLLIPFYRFIYPSVCFVCDAPLAETGDRVCADCWSSIKQISTDDALYREMHGRLLSSGVISELISAYHFEKDGTLQSVIHQLKYDGSTHLGVELGKRLGVRIVSQLQGMHVDAVLPVPLHPLKQRERGYNQSEHICEGIRSVFGLNVLPSLLRRRKYTQSQTHLTSEERRMNVGDAFEINPMLTEFVSHHTFLIVDDVITTGATIESCARVLMDNHARGVIACSVALAA